MILLPGADTHLQDLLTRAAQRSKKAFRPRTQQAYSAIFLKFLTFLSSHDFPFAPPPLPSILAFLEHLVSLGLSSPTIQNHVSALKSSYLRHSLPAPALHHPLVSRLLKAIDRSVPRVLTPKDIFTLPQFQALIQATGSHPLGIFLKPLFLLAFFGFLRISNLLPQSSTNWDPHYTLLWQDVTWDPSIITIRLRWTKTRQSRSQTAAIQVPTLRDHPLSPVNALEDLFFAHRSTPTAPLFSRLVNGTLTSITQVQARQALSALCYSLGLPYKSLGFHAFRRSGVSYLFANQVPLPHLKHHGTWKSDAVHAYLANSATAGVIPQAFTRLLSP